MHPKQVPFLVMFTILMTLFLFAALGLFLCEQYYAAALACVLMSASAMMVGRYLPYSGSISLTNVLGALESIQNNLNLLELRPRVFDPDSLGQQMRAFSERLTRLELSLIHI